MLELRNIKKKYHNGKESKQVIDNISLDINEGDFISIMGPSGSGKSTLLYIMSGILACDSGEVFFSGKSLHQMKEKDLAKIRKNQMGFVFQQAAFLKNLSILDNILLPAFNDKKRNKKELIRYAKDLMTQFGIEDLKDRMISEVSGGQLQRASICRALINKANIIFADEPTGALNSKTSEDIMKILKAVNEEGITIITVTHDRRVAAYSKKVLFLLDGKIEHRINFSDYKDIQMDDKIEIISEHMNNLQI